MYLTHLSLTNFRSFARLDLEIPRRAVLLVGSNAQGKTSLLEAVYFLAAFTSFQAHADRQLIHFNASRQAQSQVSVGRLTADYQRGTGKHHLEVRFILEPVGIGNGIRLRKEILLDKVKRQANEAIGHFNAVIFVPQMSQIVEGGPDERRRYINMALAQTYPAYAKTLSEYHQALTQRNALLKTLNEKGGSSEHLSIWDEPLTRLGSQIILWRIQALQELEVQARRIHSKLTRGKEVLRLVYQPSYDPLPIPAGQISLPLESPVDRSGLGPEEIRRGFAEKLEKIRAEEIARGQTLVGPHRDEVRFLANGIDLGYYGSRGQIRTALLSLKLAEVAWMKSRTNEWPVILLDEVMAELDIQRRADLLNYLGEAEQVLLTTTDLKLFTSEFVRQALVWQIQDGKVTPENNPVEEE
jgi:DNA replication and repair protein RecF